MTTLQSLLESRISFSVLKVLTKVFFFFHGRLFLCTKKGRNNMEICTRKSPIYAQKCQNIQMYACKK